VAQLGESADPERDVISVDGEPIRAEPPVYWLVHKPVGVLTTVRDPEGRRTVLDLVPRETARVFPVGRLDRETEGLVLLTNDGALAHALLHPSHGIEREYVATVRGRAREATLRRLAAGVPLDDGLTAPAGVAQVSYDARADTTRFHLTIIEGRKRQIRRALDALGHPVVRLLRIRMGPLRLGRLAPGAARRLDPRERSALRGLLERAGGKRRGAGHAQRRPQRPARKRTSRDLDRTSE
jgi:23S rRNA pseudouridine2605 synthase